MASFRATIFFHLLLSVLVLAQAKDDPTAYRTYFIFLSPPADAQAMSRSSHREWHHKFLPSTLTASGETRMVCSYSALFHGFAARLTEDELAAVAKLPGFVRALPDGRRELLTTRTHGFLGLTDEGDGFWSDTAGFGRGIVIGVLDSGIYGMHSSFGDDGVPEPPARWKGTCTGSDATRCNRKLVGAKSFVQDGDPQDDEEIGHGTHVASIAAGNFVPASLDDDFAFGTAAGMAPHAHVAMYKVCRGGKCFDSSITCGMEEAVHDGVDVINLSLGSRANNTFDLDPLAIGAFNAMAKGILVVAAAGNLGPDPSTLINDAPWMLTVGAGSVDRLFEAEVEYNPTYIDGETLVQRAGLEDYYPIVDGDYCRGVLGDITHKMVVCKSVPDGWEQQSIIRRLKSFGAGGVFLIDDPKHGYTTVLTNYDGYNVIQMNNFQGRDLIDYAKSMHPASAVSFNGVVQGKEIKNSPTVAYFSSRGPSELSRGLLKPDVLAPGLNIIAASSVRLPSSTGSNRSRNFKVMSGTSMAAPHVAGVVALLKRAHPEWSPAAIKSAIMTSSDNRANSQGPILDEQHNNAPYFAMGAGHINPSKATDPGLVYDLSATDYASYICGLLGENALKIIMRDPKSSCSNAGSIPEASLNLPSIVVPLKDTLVTVPRTLTLVGPAETYHAFVEGSADVMEVRVLPDTLFFSRPGEKLTFNVSVMLMNGGPTAAGEFLQASLVWASDSHYVRSPIIAVLGL